MWMQFVCTMTVPCNYCMLFELSWYRGLCTHMLRTGSIYSLVFLVLALGQIELTQVQNGPVGFGKKIHTKKQYTHCIMTVLCQGNFKEQTNKLVSLLLYTTEMCWRKYQAWVRYKRNGYNFHPQATPGVHKSGCLVTRATEFYTVATNIFSIINAILFCTYKYECSHVPSRKRQIKSKVHRSL